MSGAGERRLLGCLLAGVAGAAVCAAAALYGVDAAAPAWLSMALFWSAFPLGALPVLATYALTGGGWGEETEAALRAAAATMPLVPIAFLPLLLFGMHDLFPWTAPREALAEVVRHKTLYLNVPFFAARSILYAAVWLLLARQLGAWWGRHTPPSDTAGAGAAVAWVLSVTFFGFDWIMSLEPKWYSDIFGMVLCMALVVPAMTVPLLTAALTGAYDDAQRVSRLRDYAHLWLSVILGWVFLHFSQYLIIWIGNIPHEIEWFLHRTTGAWRTVSWAVAALLGVLPFVALLSDRIKRSATGIAAASGIALAGHLAHCIWLVLPSFHLEGAQSGWLLPAAWVALGGPWLFVFLRRRQAILRHPGRTGPTSRATVQA